MEEDLEFNRFLKGALESEGAFDFPRHQQKHSVLRWSLPALLAATFALTAILHTTFSPRIDRVSDAIQLLSLTDEIEIEGTSPSDLLLAWQDAPCKGLL